MDRLVHGDTIIDNNNKRKGIAHNIVEHQYSAVIDFDRLKPVKKKAKDPMTYNDVHSALNVCQTARMGWRC